MIIQNKIALFLYDYINTVEFVKINHLFADCGLNDIEIRNTIGKLRDLGIIEVTDDYKILGKVGWGDPYSLADVTVLARLTMKGEMYVETILPKHIKPRSK